MRRLGLACLVALVLSMAVHLYLLQQEVWRMRGVLSHHYELIQHIEARGCKVIGVNPKLKGKIAPGKTW